MTSAIDEQAESACSPKTDRPYIGGQAVLEGVMMRAPTSFAIVLRRRGGFLHVREREMKDERTGVRKWPLVRGVAALVESLKLGSESLQFSAEQMEKDLEAEEALQRHKAPSVLSALAMSIVPLFTADGDTPVTSKSRSKGPMGLMLLLVILIFVALPQGSAALLNRWLGLGLEIQSPLFQVITGVTKLFIVVGYMLAIRQMSDIRRVFQYHGAEHKTISTYEADEPLTVANARAKTTLHPRCGTTFIVMVALVSILVFTAVGGFLPRIQTGNTVLDNVVFFLEKLPFLPLIAAVTFELQRVSARYCTTGPLRVFLWPGFLVQKITTIEPDDRQLEVALASLKATLFRQDRGADGAGDRGDVFFDTYEDLLKAQTLRSAE